MKSEQPLARPIPDPGAPQDRSRSAHTAVAISSVAAAARVRHQLIGSSEFAADAASAHAEVTLKASTLTIAPPTTHETPSPMPQHA